MTTSDPGVADLGTRGVAPITTPAPPLGRGGDAGAVPGHLDDATIDRIATNLLATIPGVQGPAVPTPGAFVPEAVAALVTSVGTPTPGAAFSSPPGVVLPGAAIPNPAAAGSAPGLPAAGIPGIGSIAEALRGSSVPRLPGGEIPGSQQALASVPQSALPSAASAGPIAPFLLPPINFEGVDGTLPRLFGNTPPVPATPVVTTSEYYFLAPAPTARSASAAPLLPRRTFDVRDIRRDFPILQERVHGKPLVWLDNAATTQKPRAVIDRLVHYYEHEYSNVHRAAHVLAARSTDAYEGARQKVQRFLGAGSASEIVFVRGTTEAVNLVANSWGRKNVGEGDEIVLTTLEHHSNIVPWQFLADEVGAVLRVVPVTDRGEVLLGDYGKLLNARTRLVAITHVSNALGTILPVGEMIQAAHRHGARVLVDGAQAVSHLPVNVQALDADFYVFSGHKVFGPSAVGVVYGKKALLDEMPPWQGGGNMIQRVTFEKSTFADPPARFEAGTGTLGPAVGLGAALDYLEQIGMENIARHEHELLVHATEALRRIPGLRLIGTAAEKASVVSFIVDGMSVEEMGGFLDQEGIAVRAGHHCAQPTMDRFGLTGTVRPSLGLYNTHEEVDVLARAVRKAVRR
jgi:cysteine desulfurase / selenocysteine lyase